MPCEQLEAARPRFFRWLTLSVIACSLLGATVSASERKASPSGEETPAELVGTWVAPFVVDETKLKEILGDSSATPQAIASFKEKVADLKLQLRLQQDGTATLRTIGFGSDEPRSAKWTVVSQDGKKYRVQGVTAEGQEETIELRLLDDSRFEMQSEALKKSPYQMPVFKKQEKSS